MLSGCHKQADRRLAAEARRCRVRKDEPIGVCFTEWKLGHASHAGNARSTSQSLENLEKRFPLPSHGERNKFRKPAATGRYRRPAKR